MRTGLASWLPKLWTNWITLLGSVLTTLAGLALGLFIVVDLAAPGKNPYTSSFFILALPLWFGVGLLLIPLGLWLNRRQNPVAPGLVEKAFETALQDKTARNRILFVAALTVVNVMFLGFAGKASIEYMDSPKFCGTACHTVMQPEWSAYQQSPHANVACTECHIGAGTTSYLAAKVNGVGQVLKLATSSYHRPILPPAPLHADTCTGCHSKRVIGDKLKIYPHYKADKDNTPIYNALVLHVGSSRSGEARGIHRHANPDVEITYQLLENARIGTVTLREQGKLVGEYRVPSTHDKPLGERRMSCLDCHNRPTHIFDASPAAAVDRAIAAGRLDPKIPNLAQISAELLTRSDGRRADAEAFFTSQVSEAYRAKQLAITGEQAAATGKVLAEIYRMNVYPELNLGWGTYRSNLGHQGDGGCFRCHDNEHVMKQADGSEKKLSQDCDSCHERVAVDEDPKNLDDTTKLLLPRI
jgi:hypothetical protein